MNERDFDEYLVRVYRVRRAGREEYHQFLLDLYRQSIAPRLSRKTVAAELTRWYAERDQLFTALRNLRAAEHRLDALDPNELPADARRAANTALREAAPRVLDSVRTSNRLLVDNELAEILEESFDLVVDGMDAQEFPREDFEALAQSGSADPRGELTSIVYRLKAQKSQIPRRSANSSFAEQLQRIEQGLQQLDERIRDLSERTPVQPESAPEDKRTKRRRFKILSGLGAGSTLCLMDGFLGHAVAHIDLILGVTVAQSIVGGLGNMLTGLGEFRGE